MKRIYIAAFHQSKFGKLMGMTVPEIAQNAILDVCKEINTDPSLLDMGAVGSACNMTLNEQGLVSALVASVPGLEHKLIGHALGVYSHPDERPGRVYVFPHLFAQVQECYMKRYKVSEADLAAIAVQEYANGNLNALAQMNKVKVTLHDVVTISERNRYIVDGLPLKTYECSQITDGYATMILATEEGLKKLGVSKADTVEIAGYAQA